MGGGSAWARAHTCRQCCGNVGTGISQEPCSQAGPFRAPWWWWWWWGAGCPVTCLPVAVPLPCARLCLEEGPHCFARGELCRGGPRARGVCGRLENHTPTRSPPRAGAGTQVLHRGSLSCHQWGGISQVDTGMCPSWWLHGTVSDGRRLSSSGLGGHVSGELFIATGSWNLILFYVWARSQGP